MNFTSVIIVNYNTRELTANCINSIVKYFPVSCYEIIVVDNASADDSVSYLKSLFPEISVIANDANAGFGAANNIGVSRASGEFILLLNSDTIIKDDILSAFVKFYNQHRHLRIGALGSLLVSDQADLLVSFGNFPGLLRRKLKDYYLQSVQESLSNIEKNYFDTVDIVVGADMFMEKSVYEKMGGFDTKIFLYEEELEFQFRLRKAGCKSAIINEKSIIHLEGKSSENYFKRKCSFLSLCYIYKKHLSLPLYWYWRIKHMVFALIFFKNPNTNWKEKISYLKLAVTKK